MDDIEIIPQNEAEYEDGSLELSDDFQATSVTLDRENREYESSMHIKDDAYWRTERYKYKINQDPLEVKEKLEERSDEPPHRYAVRDGVVLESEIKKDGGLMNKSLIETLKKEVEWHTLWEGNPVGLYIISEHPEIVPKEEFRKYLRLKEEKIKNGVLKVKTFIEKNGAKFKIEDGQFGRGITTENFKDLPDVEKEKIAKERDEIYEKLFNKESKEFVGFDETEFKNSPIMLKTFDIFLNPKKPLKNQANPATPANNSGWKWLGVIGIAIVALSWGIWTAIGAFLLGTIILNLLSTKTK